jgi:hypothetical protein
LQQEVTGSIPPGSIAGLASEGGITSSAAAATAIDVASPRRLPTASEREAG